MELTKIRFFKKIILGTLIVSFLLALIAGFAIINIGVSLKYEIDHTRTVSAIKGLEQKGLDKEESKLNTQRKLSVIIFQSATLLFGLCLVTYVFTRAVYYNKKEQILTQSENDIMHK